jgi:hypothetical protein
MKQDLRSPGQNPRVALATICTLASLTVVALATATSLAEDPEDISCTYQWKPVKIGGGGFTMGIVIHPGTGDRYIRNDVNAAYRWDREQSEWRLLIRTDNIPPGDPMLEAVQYNGAQSIAVAPSDPNRVYLAWGTEYYSPSIGALYVSDDKGETWSRRSAKTDFVMKANGSIGRMQGERLAVDPANADVAYFGATTEGLWRTTDGGKSWHQIPTSQVPVGVPAQQLDKNQKSFPVGVAMVVFDLTGKVIDGQSQRIWCTVWGEGI